MYVYDTNNVLHTFLKIFVVVKCLPCFIIIADTGKRFLPLRADFFLYINMGTVATAFLLLYLNEEP